MRRLPVAGYAGLFIVVATILVAVAAGILAPKDPFTQDLMRRMVPPMWMDGGSPAKIGRAHV